LTIAQKDELKHIIRALSFGKINLSALAELSDFKKLSDISRGKAAVSQPEFIRLKKAINDIRIEAKLTLSELEKSRTPSSGAWNKLKTFLENPAVVPFILFDRNTSVWNKIGGWMMGRRTEPT